MEIFFDDNGPTSLGYVLLSFLAIMLLYAATLYFLRKVGKNPKYLFPKGSMSKMMVPLFLVFLAILLRMEALRTVLGLAGEAYLFKKASTLLLIFGMTWLVLRILKVVKEIVINNYDVHQTDNLRARKIYTQFNILERIAIFLVVIIAMGLALMTFEEIREIGISVFASAGVAGIIIGFSAQKLIGTILAGIQIAIAQPIKLDDVVIVEGEWGRIEEITLTYVVVKIWDKRRLIVPTPYFIEKPFQNWTKSSSELLATVFLFTDYRLPVDVVRQELTRILADTPLWDGEVNVVQVTDSKADYMEVRALMSAKDSPSAWDLRVHVREKLITFLQENYPQSIVHHRMLLYNNPTNDTPPEA